MQVDLAPQLAGPHKADAFVLHALNDPMDGSRSGGEAPGQGQSARDVARVAVPLAAGVQHETLLVPERGAVGAVMQRRGIGARGRDDGVRLGRSTARDGHALKDRLDLPLAGERQDALRDFAMGLAGDVVGASHHGDLVVGLDEACAVHGCLKHLEVEADLLLLLLRRRGRQGQRRRLVWMEDIDGWRAGRSGIPAKKLGQVRRVANLVDIKAAKTLSCTGLATKPQHITRLDIRNPEGESVTANVEGDGAILKVGSGQVVEAFNIKTPSLLEPVNLQMDKRGGQGGVNRAGRGKERWRGRDQLSPLPESAVLIRILERALNLTRQIDEAICNV